MLDTELLSRLVNAPAPSGFEEEVRRIVVEYLLDRGLEPQVDQVGNTYVVLGEGRPTMMIAAHMDEVGFITLHVDHSGFLRVAPLGGLRPQTLPGTEVVVLAGSRLLPGIIGAEPPHTSRGREQTGFEGLYVDIGASSREEAYGMGVRPGTPITFAGNFKDWGRHVSGKALDDRLGCYLLLRALATGAEPGEGSVVAAFTVQEEVGTRGAAAIASRIQPNFGIAVEGTIANDIPGVSEDKIVTRMGGGAAIRVMDRTLISSRRLVEHLAALAEAAGIDYQFQLSPYSGTDAGRFLLVGAEVAGIAVPARYIHSPAALALKSDIEAAEKLLAALISDPWPG